MFTRFTPEARAVVERAEREARSFAHPWIGTEHLLLGVLGASSSAASDLLVGHGVTLDTTRTALDRLVGRGGFRTEDAAALRTVGIDLDQVRQAAEASFGPGALDRPPARRCRRRSGLRRRRERVEPESDELPFMPRAKRALERARIEAERGRHGLLDVDHLLFGLLDPRGNMAVELLCQLGANPDAIGAELRARLDAAA